MRIVSGFLRLHNVRLAVVFASVGICHAQTPPDPHTPAPFQASGETGGSSINIRIPDADPEDTGIFTSVSTVYDKKETGGSPIPGSGNHMIVAIKNIVTWSPGPAYIDHYIVQRRKSGGNWRHAARVGASGNRTYTESNVESGSRYHYRVIGVTRDVSDREHFTYSNVSRTTPIPGSNVTFKYAAEDLSKAGWESFRRDGIYKKKKIEMTEISDSVHSLDGESLDGSTYWSENSNSSSRAGSYEWEYSFRPDPPTADLEFWQHYNAPYFMEMISGSFNYEYSHQLDSGSEYDSETINWGYRESSSDGHSYTTTWSFPNAEVAHTVDTFFSWETLTWDDEGTEIDSDSGEDSYSYETNWGGFGDSGMVLDEEFTISATVQRETITNNTDDENGFSNYSSDTTITLSSPYSDDELLSNLSELLDLSDPLTKLSYGDYGWSIGIWGTIPLYRTYPEEQKFYLDHVDMIRATEIRVSPASKTASYPRHAILVAEGYSTNFGPNGEEPGSPLPLEFSVSESSSGTFTFPVGDSSDFKVYRAIDARFDLDADDYRGRLDEIEEDLASFSLNLSAGEGFSNADPNGAVLYYQDDGSEAPPLQMTQGSVSAYGTSSVSIFPQQVDVTKSVKLSWSNDLELIVNGEVKSSPFTVEGFGSGGTVRIREGVTNNGVARVTAVFYGEGGKVLASDEVTFHIQEYPVRKPVQIPLRDMAGHQYRKIGVNGRPMPDSRPQSKEESDETAEETYVDAFSRHLQHSTTDFYFPVPGSNLSLSLRRNLDSEIWTMGSGLRPHERYDLPLGPCWSTNLVSTIKFTTNHEGSTAPKFAMPEGESRDNAEVVAQIGATGNGKIEAYVVDENGHPQSFARFVDFFAGPGEKVTFLPISQGAYDRKNYLNTLDYDPATGFWVYSKKFGNTLFYEMVSPLDRRVANDRLAGSSSKTVFSYARLVKVVDRLGYALHYSYRSQSTLIPSRIHASHQGVDIPNFDLEIQQDATNQRILRVWDPLGNTVVFEYSSLQPFNHPVTGIVQDTSVLGAVTNPTGDKVSYGYNGGSNAVELEIDPTPAPSDSSVEHKYHVYLTRLSTPRGHDLRFLYEVDKSKKVWVQNAAVPSGRLVHQVGIPRCIKSIMLPGIPRPVDFRGAGELHFDKENRIAGSIQTDVVDSEGSLTRYRFNDTTLVVLEDFESQYGLNEANVPSNPRMFYYKRLTIEHPIGGSEVFQFDPRFGLALVSVRDLNGNVRSFEYSDQWVPSNQYQRIFGARNLMAYFDDPTAEVRTAGGVTHRTEFSYDPVTRVRKRVEDPEGRVSLSVIDALGRVTETTLTDSQGNLLEKVSMAYHPNWKGFLTERRVHRKNGDPNWAGDLVSTYVPDGSGRVSSENIGGSVTEYVYDWNNNKRLVRDPNGHVVVFDYDARGRIVRIRNHDNSFKEFTYDPNGNKTSQTNENGVATVSVFDAMNRVVSQTTAGNRITFGYNGVGSQISMTDSNGNITRTYYDLLQRPVRIVSAVGKPEEATVTMVYGVNSGSTAFDVSGFKPTIITDPRGFTTTTVFDGFYRPTSISKAYGTGVAVTQMVYDKVGNVVETTDPKNKLTQTDYDGMNRPVKVTFPDLTTAHSLYTGTGLAWKQIDQMGRETVTEYDSQGRPVRIVAPATAAGVAIAETVYDPAGNTVAAIDPLGNRTDFVYDSRNRQTVKILPPVGNGAGGNARPETHSDYDAVGNVLSVTDPRGFTTTTLYDALNRPFEVIDPLGNRTRTEYDNNGNPLRVTDGNGNTISNVYDAHNRLLATTDAEGITVAYTYDKGGNRTSVRDGKGSTTTMTYDGLARLTRLTHPDGSFEGKGYDAVNLVSSTDAAGRATSYAYDDNHRLVSLALPDGNVRTLGYDDAGNLLAVTESHHGGKANVAYTYDALNRQLTETSRGVTHTFTLDLAGNRTQTTVGGSGRVLATTYDAVGRLLSLSESGRTTTYAYDLAGNLVTRGAPGGQVENLTYDALGRTTTRTVTSGGVPVQTFQYGYDRVGNVVAITETYRNLEGRTLAMAYDRAYRLTSEAIVQAGGKRTLTAYGYDAAYNRTSKVVTGDEPLQGQFVYNSLNQLVTYADAVSGRTVTYEYDIHGNRTKRTTSDGEIDTYSWDVIDRLSAVGQEGRIRKIDITGPNGQKVQATYRRDSSYQYHYDYRSRRVNRSDNGIETALVFLGGTSILEYEGDQQNPQPVPGQGAAAVEYIRGSDMGGGVGGILYTLRDGQPSYTWSNGRGDVVAKTDGQGAVTWQAAYEAFGTRTEEAGHTEDRQRGNSKDEDPTGLLNEGFRYRDLETGTWLSRDPAGFVDGPNLYAYVRQNPWSKFDPLGLERRDSNNFLWASTDHHEVPVKSVLDRGFTSPIAKQAFDDARIKTPNGHNSTLHGEQTGYSAHVNDELDKYMVENKLTKESIGKMSALEQTKHAKNMISRVRSTENRFIRGFNANVSKGPTALSSWYSNFISDVNNHSYVKHKHGKWAAAKFKATGRIAGKALSIAATPIEELTYWSEGKDAAGRRDELYKIFRDSYQMTPADSLDAINRIQHLEQGYKHQNFLDGYGRNFLHEDQMEKSYYYQSNPESALKDLISPFI